MTKQRDEERTRLIQLAKEAAAANDGVLRRNDFVRLTGVSSGAIYRLFPEGGLKQLLSLSGIPEHPEAVKRNFANGRSSGRDSSSCIANGCYTYTKPFPC